MKNSQLNKDIKFNYSLTLKIPTFMRIAILLLFVFILQAGANSLYSQSARISINMSNATVEEILNVIEKESEFYFLYNSKLINVDRKASVNVKSKSVESVLNALFDKTDVVYKIENKQIILSSKGFVESINLQNRKTISGVVSGEDGEPVAGASIVEKGTTNGTTTDIDGKFSLSVIDDAILQISYIGYITQEITTKNQNFINITLAEDAMMLDEVVVIGYGTMKRKNFTGSVSTVNVASSPISLSSRTNVMDMLRGVVTGATISREMASGSTPSIQVHGQKSISSSSSNPLIVMDGVIYMGGWRDIDPSTVENISVLKDATSLAAYGSQAANGVVMITTKKGKIGKPVITFDASLAVSNKTLIPQYLSPENFVKKTNEALDATDGNPQSWMKPSAYENYLAGRTIDWIDYVTRTGINQNYSTSVSGASEKLNYYLSLSHTDQKGIIYGDDYSREALMSRLESDITNWLQVGAQVNYTYNNYDGVTAGMQPYLSPYSQAVRPNGNLEKYVMEEGAFAVNPLWSTDKGGYVDDRERYTTTALKGHVLIKAPWIEGLTYRFNTTYSEEVYKRDRFTHEGYYVTEGIYTNDERYSEKAIAGYLSSANGSNQRRFNTYYVLDNILNYNVQLGAHFFDITAVYTRDKYTSDNRTLTGSNYESLGNTILKYDGLAFAETQIAGISKTEKTNIGYLGRLNYNYYDRYHISASVRRDGSSVFGINNKWGVFPAVGVAWTASREEFMKKIPAVSYLKLKASWGKNGNQSLGAYGTLSTIALGITGNHPYLFGNSGKPSWAQFVNAIGNSELGWESTTKINGGFDIGLFNDRIYLGFDAYKSKTTEQIFDRVIPVMSNGFTNTKATMGQVDNRGVEFTLNSTNIKTKDITWSSMLNFYLNRNKLVELYGDGKDDIGSSLFLGKSLGAIYGYKTIGIIQEEDIEYIQANNAIAGNPKFANIDGSADGKITPEDRTILGYRKENFIMNMSQTLTYKDWELYALFTGVFSGGDYGVEANSEAFLTNSSFVNNIDHTWWTPENRNNEYPRAKFDGSNYTPIQSFAFVRLQDLNLSYTFRQKYIKDSGINTLRLYLSARNLFTITNWVGGDPEIRQKYAPLASTDTYPLLRTFSLGLNISF